ncbi:hypothetical protein K7432_004065 [Basidiobolus ranarum]|uniref:Uncharacterized protein n=1 Tax=Basidiobolus ranarum TaxID=34480 RepID=A0ABR2W5G8_9FUNG
MSGSPEVNSNEDNVEAETISTTMKITNIVNPPPNKKRKAPAEEKVTDPSKTLTAAAKDSVTVEDRFEPTKLNNSIRLLRAVQLGDHINMGEQYSNMLRHCKNQSEEDDMGPLSQDIESVYNYLAWIIHPQDANCDTEPSPQSQRILKTLLHNLTTKIVSLGCLEQRKHVARKLALVKANLEGIKVKTTSKKKKTDKDRPASSNPLSITRPMLDPFKAAGGSLNESEEDTHSPN